MGKLLESYNYLKKQNCEKLYIFKSGIFYIALQDDAKVLSKVLNLKITKLGTDTIKCGFPCKSLPKYKLLLEETDLDIQIVDGIKYVQVDDYTKNSEVIEILNEINNFEAEKFSEIGIIDFIHKLQEKTKKVLNIVD